MTHRQRRVSACRLLVGTAVAGGALLASTSAASAHADVYPARIAVATTTEVDLVLDHGCGVDGEPGVDEPATPTVLVELIVPDDLRIEALPVPGWRVLDDGGGSIVWEATGPGTDAALVLPLRVAAEEGTTSGRLEVVQTCDDATTLFWDDDLGGSYPAPVLVVSSASQPAEAVPTETGAPVEPARPTPAETVTPTPAPAPVETESADDATAAATEPGAPPSDVASEPDTSTAAPRPPSGATEPADVPAAPVAIASPAGGFAPAVVGPSPVAPLAAIVPMLGAVGLTAWRRRPDAATRETTS